jgi:predicted transcriptional regulator
MIEAKANFAHVHVEASAKDDATLVAEAAVMFLGTARSIVENADDAELVRFTLGRVVNDVAERIKEGKLDDDDTETEEKSEKAEESEVDRAINAIVERVLQELKKKDGNA